MKTKEEYFEEFLCYPDLVTLTVFREMLGGIGESTARKLVKQNRVKHFMINTTILIPKSSIVSYLTSKHYQNYKDKLKNRVD